MGDWYYYSTLMNFKDIAQRIKLPEEIDQKYSSSELKLGDWIQRKIQTNRIENIVRYLRNQEQRFFNSIIVGIFDGAPSWQDLNIKNSEFNDRITETELEYFSRTFGILTLSGEESLFAIDGQHRAIAIRDSIVHDKKLEGDEVSIIFVAHSVSENGIIRTRRLFSTLNKYAKPVSQSEIIALSEDNNCAIITRDIIENYSSFKGKILVNKNRSISIENTTAFTNIMVLYDIIERITTNKNVYNIYVGGRDKDDYITNRVSDRLLHSDYTKCINVFDNFLLKIPFIKDFFDNGNVDRKLKSTSLLFRPIGQNILFDVYKVANDKNKRKAALRFFKKDNFNLENKHWKKVFWDKETQNISTEKSKQRFATLLILEKLGIKINRTATDQRIYNNYKIKPEDI